MALRRRLVDDFQQPPTDPEEVGRAEVMRRLLECYEREGGAAGRRVVRVNGTPVDPEVLDELLTELRQWYAQRSRGARGNQQERPSISVRAVCVFTHTQQQQQHVFPRGPLNLRRA